MVDEIKKRNLLRRKVSIVCDMSVAFDTLRLPVRTFMTGSKEKVSAFPNFSDVFSQLMQYHMQSMEADLIFVTPDRAEVEIEIIGHLGLAEGDSIAMLRHFLPDYQHKKKKIRLGQMKLDDRFEVGRVAVDKVLRHLKSMSIKDMGVLLKSYREHLKSLHLTECNEDSTNFKMPSQIKWIDSITVKPLYVLGRYRKLARDVPQAPWDVKSNKKEDREDDNDDDCDDDVDDEGNNDKEQKQQASEIHAEGTETTETESLYPKGVHGVERQRKGRNSVEEIVSESVCKFLDAKTSRMHPCGREDIDVRMLGNITAIITMINMIVIISITIIIKHHYYH